MATNEPENSTEGEQAVSQDNTGNVSGTAGQMKTFEPPQLNKASFLVRRNNTASPQNQVKTRQQEMILAAETTPHSLQTVQQPQHNMALHHRQFPPQQCEESPTTLICTYRKTQSFHALWITALFPIALEKYDVR